MKTRALLGMLFIQTEAYIIIVTSTECWTLDTDEASLLPFFFLPDRRFFNLTFL